MGRDTIARGLALTGKLAYASGEYFRPQGQLVSGTGAAAAAGAIRWTFGFLHNSVTISSLLVNVTTAATGGLFQLSLYKADAVTNKPTGAPLFTSTSQATDATGVKEIAASLALPSGGYWAAVQVDTTGAATVFSPVANGATGFVANVGVKTTAGLLGASSLTCGYTKAGTFGTWPTLTGTGENASDSLIQSVTTVCPAWAFKVA